MSFDLGDDSPSEFTKQEGITNGEVQQQETFSRTNGEVTSYVEDSQSDSGSGRRRITRPKRFRTEWMNFDIFKDWLQPHESKELARCTVCRTTIKAGKSELEKHATGKRHLKMLMGLRSGTETPANHSTVAKKDGDSALKISNRTTENFSPTVQNPPQNRLFSSFVMRPAPPWNATAIVNGHITTLDLNDYSGRYVLMVFYCQDFSKLCARIVNNLSDHVEDFRSIHSEIVCCSTDSHESHLLWSKRPRKENGTPNLKLPLLADPDKEILRAYVHDLAEGNIQRAYFIIDPLGILRHAVVTDPNVSPATDEFLRLIQSLQYVDDTEESTPVDWTADN